jgi:predicted RNA-binding protein with PUA-like domain
MICQVSVSIGQSVRVTVFYTPNNEWGRFSGLQMLLRSAKGDVQTDSNAETHDAFVREKRRVVQPVTEKVLGVQILLRSAKTDVQNDSDAETHDAFVRKKRRVVKPVTEKRWKFSEILFHIWLKRQLLFIVSAMPGPSEVGHNKKCSIVQVKWDADKNGKAYVNTDFPISTDSFIGHARSCEMLKAYLEEAARHETRAREKESLIAYDTQFLV